ncbi:MAG TPA: hypothetical protein VFZ27_15185 [Terriglobia bacterium]|nr:hypothetical protein [Terriglobia bacterium]
MGWNGTDFDYNRGCPDDLGAVAWTLSVLLAASVRRATPVFVQMESGGDEPQIQD